MKQKTRTWELSTMALQLIAMAAMLLDHTYYTRVVSWEWMTCVGRIAFPIYCFMAVEGFFHTSHFGRYLLRLLGFALLSELPFNLMVSGRWLYSGAQNVMWTLLLGLCGVWCMERAKKSGKIWLMVLTFPLVLAVFRRLGNLCMVDYRGAGVLTIFVFYLFRGRRWWQLLGQLLGLLLIHTRLLVGYYYNITLFGLELGFGRQALALLALIPIWLYRGRQGPHSRAFQYFRYAFYPAHMLALSLVRML